MDRLDTVPYLLLHIISMLDDILCVVDSSSPKFGDFNNGVLF